MQPHRMQERKRPGLLPIILASGAVLNKTASLFFDVLDLQLLKARHVIAVNTMNVRALFFKCIIIGFIKIISEGNKSLFVGINKCLANGMIQLKGMYRCKVGSKYIALNNGGIRFLSFC